MAKPVLRLIYDIYQPYESVLPFGKGTTANIYSHVDSESKKLGANAISAALGSE